MKNLVAGTVLLLLGYGCHQPQPASVIQSIASTANETLIKKLESGEELKLTAVLKDKNYYGLSSKEVELIQQNFSDKDISRLVLSYVDPRGLKGKVPARWAYVASNADDSVDLKKLEAMDADGKIDIINGTDRSQAPEFPIITLGVSEKLNGSVTTPPDLAEAGNFADGALMLNTISFADVREPWIKGPAEIYAVVSYIAKDGKGANEIVELTSVDGAGKVYDLRQLIHFWKANRYQTTNIAFFEHDSEYNYGQLAKILVTAASAITTSTVTETVSAKTVAITGILAELTSRVIDSLPKDALEDNDDYLDMIQTVDKAEPGQRSGVSANVQAVMSLFKNKHIDE